MADPGGATVLPRRALSGAVLLDLAVSPLFAWDVFTGSLRRDLGASDALLAGVFSVGLLAFMLGVLLGGRVADAVAPRRLALVTLGGLVLGLLGSAAASTVITLFVCFGVLVGGSSGLGYVVAVRVAGTVASGRGLALGLVVSAYALGTAALAPLASVLLGAIGRQATFLVMAGALAVLLAAAAVLVPGAAPQPSPRPDPSPRRARPSGAVVALWLAFALGAAPALAAFAQAGNLAGAPGAAVVAVTLLNLGNFAGRIAAGPLSDRCGRRAALHTNAALLMLACLPLALAATGPFALVALLLLGTQYGALSTLTPAATSDVVAAQHFGTTYGLVFTGWGIAGLLAPVAAAALAPEIGYGGVYRAFLGIAAMAWACVATYGRLVHGEHQP